MIKPLVNMSAHEGRDGKRFLEGLILRAEDVLAKMIYKVHKNLVTLDEMVPMINSVYGFVNTWEKSLADINLDLVVAGGSKSNETSVMEQINKLDFKDRAVEKKPEKGSRKKHSLKDEEEAEPVFEYLEPSLKDYHPNRTGCCVISYVGPAKLSFCLVDRGQPDCTKIIAAMQNARGTRLTQLPAPGEVFGVFLDGSLFRAVRNKVVENTPLKTAYLRLLDTGEIVPYEEDFMLCSLSEYYRKIPAFALRCVLVNVLDDPFCDDLHNYLQNNLHTNQYYKVVSAEKSVLFLKLSQQPILPADGDSQPTVSSKISSSPRLDIFKPNSTPAYNAAPTIRPSVSMEKEKSSCPFFDSVRSTCAKGAHRRNESVPEGDNAVGDQYIVPPVGSMVHVVPKFIRGVDHFWCQVVAKDSADCDLLEMETKMNGSESVARYRKLTKPPYFKQRVFALYVDKHWYRAEVARYFDENNVLVFYVDYGNAEIVSMKEIRQWDEKFSYLPYQAVLCRFASVCQVKPNHTQAVVELNRKLLNRRFMAKIMNNSCPWELIIYDEDGFDFSKGLLLAGLAKKPDSNDDDMEDETSAVAA